MFHMLIFLNLDTGEYNCLDVNTDDVTNIFFTINQIQRIVEL